MALRVSVSVHTGAAEERGARYFGPVVTRSARLMSSASGGQVLVSLTTAEVVRDALPAGMALVELGERALRSLRRPERVFELRWSTAAQDDIAVEVLGPLRLRIGGSEVRVPGPKRRALLALLAMAAPHPIGVEALLAALWPDDEAGAERASLQSHVWRLRRDLGPAADRLETGPGGYRLRLRSGELDAAAATELLDRARQIADEDPAGALGAVRSTRALWRGPALDEFRDVEPLAAW